MRTAQEERAIGTDARPKTGKAKQQTRDGWWETSKTDSTRERVSTSKADSIRERVLTRNTDSTRERVLKQTAQEREGVETDSISKRVLGGRGEEEPWHARHPHDRVGMRARRRWGSRRRPCACSRAAGGRRGSGGAVRAAQRRRSVMQGRGCAGGSCACRRGKELRMLGLSRHSMCMPLIVRSVAHRIDRASVFNSQEAVRKELCSALAVDSPAHLRLPLPSSPYPGVGTVRSPTSDARVHPGTPRCSCRGGSGEDA